MLCSYPPKEASKIAVSTAQQFSEDIKEVRCSSAPKFFTVKYDTSVVLWNSILKTPLLDKNIATIVQ